MEIAVLVAPRDRVHIRGLGLTPANLAYGLAPGPRLRRTVMLPRNFRGGLLALTDEGWDCGIKTAPALAGELLRECAQRQYSGVLADFEGEDDGRRRELLSVLSKRLAARGLRFFVPEEYGAVCPEARVVVSTAISGGSLRQRLEEAVGRFGAERLAVEAEKLRMNFKLPSPLGVGRRIDEDELAALLEKHRPQSYFSPELCAHYFTCREPDGSHFVLYDSEASLEQKLRTAEGLGIKTGFLVFSEAEELLKKLGSS